MFSFLPQKRQIYLVLQRFTKNVNLNPKEIFKLGTIAPCTCTKDICRIGSSSSLNIQSKFFVNRWKRNFGQKSNILQNIFIHQHHQSIINQQNSNTFSTSAGSNDAEIISLAEEIIKSTKEKDIMVESIQKSEIVNLVSALRKKEVSPGAIQALLSGRVWLLQDGDVVVSVFETLREHGFKKIIAIFLFENLPYEYLSNREFVKNLPNILDKSLVEMRHSNLFSEKGLEQILLSAPSVLFTDLNLISEQHAKLRTLFSTEETSALIEKHPIIMIQNFDEICEIFEYVYSRMKYNQEQMLESNIFTHDLDHIKDRHLFMLRTGNFEQLNKDVGKELNPNPPLRDVVDSSVDDFVHICGISEPFEYEAYEALRELEREEEDIGSSDDDNDEDTLLFPKKRTMKKRK